MELVEVLIEPQVKRRSKHGLHHVTIADIEVIILPALTSSSSASCLVRAEPTKREVFPI